MGKIWNPFWIEAIQTEFAPQIKAIVDVLEERLLPNIAEEIIEAESKRISDEKWEEFMSMPGTGDEDPGDFVDPALNAGISHYGLMIGIRQGMINQFAAVLYHAFEQQVMFFHRKNVLNYNEENDPKLFTIPKFKRRLQHLGIKIDDLASWQKIEELRLVANTVKHAEGGSSHKLRDIRSDLFKDPNMSDISMYSAPPIFQPLFGDGLYLSLKDIEDYRDHLVRFWQVLANEMQPS